MPTGLISSSLSGLYAAQSAIQATQRNIANASSPGYHRQLAAYSTAITTQYTSGAIGNGVNVNNLTRAYDRFLDNNVLLNQGQLSRYETYASYASQVDTLLGDSKSGLGKFLSEFFAGVQEVANDPTSTTARQTLLSKANILTSRMNAYDAALTDMGQVINQQMRDMTTQVNNYAQQIASINARIVMAQSSGDIASANNLLDQRDQLVGEINKLVTVTTVEQQDGAFSLYVGSGQPLVVGNQSNTLTLTADPNDTTRLTPALKIGSYLEPIGVAQIGGGQIGGLLAFREEILVPTQRELGTLAYSLASEFNAIHQAGYGLDGVTGRDFFTLPALRQPVPASTNTGGGSLSLTLTDIGQLAMSDYRLSFDGTDYTLTRLADGTSYSNASLAGLNLLIGPAEGFTLAGAGLASGDRFLIRPTENAAASIGVVAGLLASHIAAAGEDPLAPGTSAGPGDNSQALLLAGLAGSKVLSTGSNTLATFYSSLVGRNATLANGADANVIAYESLTTQASNAQQAFSGVNLDEEAANLIQYQQIYQAAARALQTSSTLFNDILAIGR